MKMHPDALRLSDTRWACRYHACKNLMDRLPAVLRVLHEIDVENSGERSVEARGLLIQIDLMFIATLAVFRKLLCDAKCVSDMLQAPSLDLARAVDLIHALHETLQDCRAGSFLMIFGSKLWRLQRNVMLLLRLLRKGHQEGAPDLVCILLNPLLVNVDVRKGTKISSGMVYFTPSWII